MRTYTYNTWTIHGIRNKSILCCTKRRSLLLRRKTHGLCKSIICAYNYIIQYSRIPSLILNWSTLKTGYKPHWIPYFYEIRRLIYWSTGTSKFRYEDCESLLYKAFPFLRVPSGILIVKTEQKSIAEIECRIIYFCSECFHPLSYPESDNLIDLQILYLQILVHFKSPKIV